MSCSIVTSMTLTFDLTFKVSEASPGHNFVVFLPRLMPFGIYVYNQEDPMGKNG